MVERSTACSSNGSCWKSSGIPTKPKSKENHHGRYPRGDTFREPKRNERSNETYKSRQLFRKKDYRDARMERDSQITCYNCRKLGHIAKNCPEKAFLIKEFHVDNMCCKGEVNGKFVSNIQIDTEKILFQDSLGRTQ